MFLLYGVQTSPELYPDPCSMDTGAISQDVQRSVPEADHSPSYSSEVKTEWTYTPTPLTLIYPYFYLNMHVVCQSSAIVLNNSSVAYLSLTQ